MARFPTGEQIGPRDRVTSNFTPDEPIKYNASQAWLRAGSINGGLLRLVNGLKRLW